MREVPRAGGQGQRRVRAHAARRLGLPDQPFNFASSDKRKCGSTNADLYRTFMTGVNGSPMPSFGDSISPQDGWDLVHYVLTLQTPPNSEYPIAEHF